MEEKQVCDLNYDNELETLFVQHTHLFDIFYVTSRRLKRMVPRINPYQLEAIGTKTCNNNNLNCSDLRTYFYTSHPDILHIDTATFEATILGKANPWTTNAIKITELWPASRLVNARQKQSIKQLTFSASVYRHACLRTPEIRRTINIMAEEIATTK